MNCCSSTQEMTRAVEVEGRRLSGKSIFPAESMYGCPLLKGELELKQNDAIKRNCFVQKCEEYLGRELLLKMKKECPAVHSGGRMCGVC